MWLFAVILSTVYLSFDAEDGNFIKSSYYMDSLTSIRVINMHSLAPFLIPIFQKFIFLCKTLSFRGGEDAVFGGCRVFGLTTSK
jgi:hypothetical protein